MNIYVGDIPAFLLVLAGIIIMWSSAHNTIRHAEWSEMIGLPIGIALLTLGIYEMYLLRYDQVTYSKIICFHPGAC